MRINEINKENWRNVRKKIIEYIEETMINSGESESIEILEEIKTFEAFYIHIETCKIIYEELMEAI